MLRGDQQPEAGFEGRFTYQPRTEAGKASLEGVATAVEPLEAMAQGAGDLFMQNPEYATTARERGDEYGAGAPAAGACASCAARTTRFVLGLEAEPDPHHVAILTGQVVPTTKRRHG